MEYYGNNDWRDYKVLSHHGVLGMKWGIRRYQPYSVVPRGSGKKGREIGDASRYDAQISRAKRKIEKNNVKIAKSKARLDSDKAKKRDKKVKKLERKNAKLESSIEKSKYKGEKAIGKALEKEESRLKKAYEKEGSRIKNTQEYKTLYKEAVKNKEMYPETVASAAYDRKYPNKANKYLDAYVKISNESRKRNKATPIQSARIINKGRKTLNQQSKQALINGLYSGIDKNVAKKAWETSDYEALKKQIKELNKGDIKGYKEKIDYGSYKAKRPVTTGTLAVDIASKAYNESRKKRR